MRALRARGLVGHENRRVARHVDVPQPVEQHQRIHRDPATVRCPDRLGEHAERLDPAPAKELHSRGGRAG